MNNVRENLKAGKYDEILSFVYCGKDIQEQKVRYLKAIDTFEKLYGEKKIEIYSAPGRTEIGGNHTDHQNGKVLAGAINLDAVAVVSKREDNIVRIKSEGYGELSIDLNYLEPDRKEIGKTPALIRGVACGMKKRGFRTGGFDAYVISSVLSGSGLSSSAAYEVLIGNILSGLYNNSEIDAVTLAQIGQEAENIHFGKPCGLLDQMASSVGGLVTIDFFDKKKPVVRKIDVDFKKYNHSLCIIDTKGSHANLTDEYAAVPGEMKKVAEFFGKNVLTEINKEEFYDKINEVRKFAGDRAVLRAMHLYAENERVEKQVKAIESGDFDQFKKLIKESGNSSFKYLQNVYATKNVKEQSVSVALALCEEILGEKGVSRVHGGGFAGTIQAFVPDTFVPEFKSKTEKIFGKDSCYVLSIRPVGGTKIL